MFRHILVPLDGSTRAEQALPIAARLARASRGTITLFQAVTLAHEVSPYGIEAPYLAPHRIEDTLAISRHYLEQQRQNDCLRVCQVCIPREKGGASRESMRRLAESLMNASEL